MREEKKGHGATGDLLLCPKEALRSRVTHLRKQGAPANTPLAHFKTPRGRWTNVTPTMITDHLKATVKFLAETHLGFTYIDVSAWSLQEAGAISLLCSGMENDIISLIARWRSDEIIRYLHVQADPIMRNFSKLMISHGNYNLLPHNEVPIY